MCQVFRYDDEAEAAGRTADLLERGIGDAHARPAVDQQQLPLECRKPRRMLGEHGSKHRPDAELLGALALQLDFRDAALDHLDADAAVLDVLRRNDRAAQVKAGGAIEIADGLRDRCEVGLRDLLAEIGLIGRGQRSSRGIAVSPIQQDAAKHELRLGIGAVLGPASAALAAGGRPAASPARVQVVEMFLGLPRDRSPAGSPAARRRRREQRKSVADQAEKGNAV